MRGVLRPVAIVMAVGSLAAAGSLLGGAGRPHLPSSSPARLLVREPQAPAPSKLGLGAVAHPTGQPVLPTSTSPPLSKPVGVLPVRVGYMCPAWVTTGPGGGPAGSSPQTVYAKNWDTMGPAVTIYLTPGDGLDIWMRYEGDSFDSVYPPLLSNGNVLCSLGAGVGSGGPGNHPPTWEIEYFALKIGTVVIRAFLPSGAPWTLTVVVSHNPPPPTTTTTSPPPPTTTTTGPRPPTTTTTSQPPRHGPCVSSRCLP